LFGSRTRAGRFGEERERRQRARPRRTLRAEADKPSSDGSSYRLAPAGAVELTVGNGFSQGLGSGMYGLDILRVRVGADYKLGPSTSIGPMVGASLSTLLTVDDSSTSSPKDIESPGLSTFVFAGVQGRFEIGGKRVRAGGKEVASR